MNVLVKGNWQFPALFTALALIAPLGLSQPVDAASASGKKAKSSGVSVGSYSTAPKPRVRHRGTAYNFTNWERDTTHEGYGEYYDGRFQFFGQTPRVGYSERRY